MAAGADPCAAAVLAAACGTAHDAVTRRAAGADVVRDLLGCGFNDPAFRTLQRRGRHLVIGFAASTNLALLKGSLVGMDIRQFMEREPAEYTRNLARVCEPFDRGALSPQIHSTLARVRWREALSTVERHDTIGRVVLHGD